MSLPLGGKTGLTNIQSNFFCAYLICHKFLTHCLNNITPIALVSVCFIPKNISENRNFGIFIFGQGLQWSLSLP